MNQNSWIMVGQKDGQASVKTQKHEWLLLNLAVAVVDSYVLNSFEKIFLLGISWPLQSFSRVFGHSELPYNYGYGSCIQVV